MMSAFTQRLFKTALALFPYHAQLYVLKLNLCVSWSLLQLQGLVLSGFAFTMPA